MKRRTKNGTEAFSLWFSLYFQLVLARVKLNMAAHHRAVTHVQRHPSPLYEAVSCSHLAKITARNLIGPFECDRQQACPITFQVLPSPFPNTLYDLFPRQIQEVLVRSEEMFHLVCCITNYVKTTMIV